MIIGLGGDGLVVISIEFLEKGRRPPRDVLLAKRPNHAFPTGDALSLAHGKCVTDRLGHFERFIGKQNQSQAPGVCSSTGRKITRGNYDLCRSEVRIPFLSS